MWYLIIQCNGQFLWHTEWGTLQISNIHEDLNYFNKFVFKIQARRPRFDYRSRTFFSITKLTKIMKENIDWNVKIITIHQTEIV